MHEFPMRSIEFVLAFYQDYLDLRGLMELPLGMGVDGNRGEWFLKLNKSLYGINQVSENWFDLLKSVLKSRGYHQSQVDPSVFYRKDSVIQIMLMILL